MEKEMERLNKVLNPMPSVVLDNIEFFKQLDEEYDLNAQNNRLQDGIMFSPKHIKNKSWRGLWYKATGIDKNLYINWLYAAVKQNRNDIMQYYRESHPKEKYIPLSITKVEETLQKLNVK